MALIQGAHPRGACVDLRGPRHSTLVATAPDGLVVRVPAPNGRASLWLPQPGEWGYQWETDDAIGPGGTLTVTEPDQSATLPWAGSLELHPGPDRMGTSLATIHQGERFTVTATLRDTNGAPLPGANLTARALLREHGITLGAMVDHDDGTYTVPFTPEQPGPWHVRLASARPVVVAEGVINVRRTLFTT